MNEQYIKQKGWLWMLANARSFKQGIPKPLKRIGRKLLPLESYDAQRWLAEDPYVGVEEASTYRSKTNVCLGIIKEFTRIHSYYIGACRDLRVPYKVLDISGPNWLDVIRHSECDAFLIRPSGEHSAWKQMFDERLRIVSQDLNRTLFPSYNEIWFYESKRRMHYWLSANQIPHPRTWVYYDRHDALAFADATPLPIVFKSDFGSGARGIRVFRERGKLIRWINRCFRQGMVQCGGDQCDRQWGSVLFQEYLPGVMEWRVIRIGDSYMGYQKIKRGEFASGSKRYNYVCPPSALLEFVRSLTQGAGFKSMAVDVFEAQDGRYLVNELQTTFGLHVDDGLPMKEGKPGRMLFDDSSGTWHFEEGLFCQNKLCNLRVQTLLKQIGGTQSHANDTLESEACDEI